MKSPLVADIKRNALDDGPGIRTVLFFKGCPLSCVWCHNPESVRANAELLIRAEQCIRCGDCWEVCKHAPGETGLGADGQPLAWVDRALCDVCGACADECPAGAREVVGQRYGVDELVELVLRDQRFYTSSGGGLTLSGGEATLYTEFVGEVAQAVHRRGVHVLLETCGEFDWETFAAFLLPHLDLIYYDLKLAESEAHTRFCGRGNERIHANLARLLQRAEEGACEVLVRVPLVPDVTATEHNLEAIADLLRHHGVRRLALLPYNPMWVNKSEGVGRQTSSAFEAERWMPEPEVRAAQAVFADFDVVVG